MPLEEVTPPEYWGLWVPLEGKKLSWGTGGRPLPRDPPSPGRMATLFHSPTWYVQTPCWAQRGAGLSKAGGGCAGLWGWRPSSHEGLWLGLLSTCSPAAAGGALVGRGIFHAS